MKDTSTRLAHWLNSFSSRPTRIEALSGDVSRRQYFRVEFENHETAIGVAYPDDMHPVCARFSSTTNLLRSVDVRVPEILESDCAHGLMLVEDLGSESLYDLSERPWEDLAPYFDQACLMIQRIQQLPGHQVTALGNPTLDVDLLALETEISWQALRERQALPGPPRLLQKLRDALNQISEAFSDCQMTVCHRDFMGRNLMLPHGTEKLVVIDYQDLRIGPLFYDLASLLNDSLFPPAPLEESLRSSFVRSSGEEQLYHRCAVQRTFKAAGTFARFAADGDDRHLPLIPPTLLRAVRHLHHLPEGNGISADLESRMLASQAAPVE